MIQDINSAKEPSLFESRYSFPNRERAFEPYRPRQAQEFKMSFTLRQIAFLSMLLMASGISLGIGIMQYVTQ